ncbi:putative papain-like cysteine peptidase superfamily [Arabidopsis thaliana]
MKGSLPSRGIYDPMTPVDLAKLHKLKDYLSSPDSKKSLDTGIDEVDFYGVIMTKRKFWLDSNYGWLGDKQMAAYMKVLALRHQRDPCPYHNKRVMILDPWFTIYWVQDQTEEVFFQRHRI